MKEMLWCFMYIKKGHRDKTIRKHMNYEETVSNDENKYRCNILVKTEELRLKS